MGNMGIGEWIVILVLILIFFGPERLPSLAQSIGKSVRELKKGFEGITDGIKESIQTPVSSGQERPPHEIEMIKAPEGQPVPTDPSGQEKEEQRKID